MPVHVLRRDAVRPVERSGGAHLLPRLGAVRHAVVALHAPDHVQQTVLPRNHKHRAAPLKLHAVLHAGVELVRPILTREGVGARLRRIAQQRHRRAVVPHHVQPLAEMLPPRDRQTHKRELVRLRLALDAEVRNLEIKALQHEPHIAGSRLDRDVRDVRRAVELHHKTIPFSDDSVRGIDGRLRGMREEVLVVVGTVLRKRAERHLHALRQTLLARLLGDERRGAAGIGKDEPERLVLDHDIRRRPDAKHPGENRRQNFPKLQSAEHGTHLSPHRPSSPG